MTAKEAKAISAKANEFATKKAAEEDARLEPLRQEARVRGVKDAEKKIEEIEKQITEACALGKTEIDRLYISEDDHQFGRYYLSALVVNLTEYFRRNGYYVDVIKHSSYSAVYENAESVESSYSGDAVTIELNWK